MNIPTSAEVRAAIPAANAVLKKISHYDPAFFKATPELATAWAEHIATTNLAVDDLLAGVTAYYVEHPAGERPYPGSITAAARKVRRERSERESAAEQAARLDERDRRLELITYEQPALVTAPSRRTYGEPASAGAAFTRCPICSAPPGKPCRNTADDTVKADHHPARRDLAAANADARRAPKRLADPLTHGCPACGSPAGAECQSGGLPMWDVHAGRRA